jgi:hypothetical protein
LHIKPDLINDFLKAMDQYCVGIRDMKKKLPSRIDCKMKEVFVGPQIKVNTIRTV